MKRQVVSRWLLFCEPCSYKQIMTAEQPGEGLVEIQTSPIPGGVPTIDPETKKIKAARPTPQPKKVKCPQCGRGVVIRRLPDVYANAFKAVDEMARKEQEASEKKKRIEDGKPHIRTTEEFLG